MVALPPGYPFRSDIKEKDMTVSGHALDAAGLSRRIESLVVGEAYFANAAFA